MSRVRAAFRRWPLRNVPRRQADPPTKWLYLLLGALEIGWSLFDLTLARDLGEVVTGLTLFLFGCLWMFWPRQHRGAYYRGWFAGRRAFWTTLEEAESRGLRPHEWLQGEIERDIATLHDWGRGG